MLEETSLPGVTNAALERFAARCAHDLNNLLTGVLGYLELMQNRARRAGVSEFDSYMEGARHAAGRATEFTRRLLIFAGHTLNEPVAVPVNTLIRDLAELMRAEDFSITTDLAEDAGAAFCDHAQLELLLAELLNNAREAAAKSAGISTRAIEAEVEIAISDTGTGMTPEILARCAEPFFTTRAGGAGKGLGLTIVNKIIADAAGTLCIACEKGTTVRLRLPRAPV